jgi:hypothetical protein
MPTESAKPAIQHACLGAQPVIHISAVGVGHRRLMQGWFSQIVIGVVVTVLGTIIANAITGGRVGHHFVPGFYSSRH